MQLGSGGKPVDHGQVDVQHGHVGTVFQRCGNDAVAGRDSGDHFQVVLEVEHGHQRVAEDAHVFSDEHPDHPFLLDSTGRLGRPASTSTTVVGSCIGRCRLREASKNGQACVRSRGRD